MSPGNGGMLAVRGCGFSCVGTDVYNSYGCSNVPRDRRSYLKRYAAKSMGMIGVE